MTCVIVDPGVEVLGAQRFVGTISSVGENPPCGKGGPPDMYFWPDKQFSIWDSSKPRIDKVHSFPVAFVGGRGNMDVFRSPIQPGAQAGQ